MVVFKVPSALLLLMFSLPSLWAKGPAANRKGNEAYRKGSYEQAVTHYGKAVEALPGDRTIAYNTGTALLKQKKYDDALKSLMAGAGDSRKDVKSRSLYNAGNALAESQKLPEALSAYRQAILANPGDMDAKFNYELAKRKLQQSQDQNKDDKNKDDKNKDDKNKDQQKNQDQKQDQDKDQNKENQDQQQQNADENKDQAQQDPNQPKPEQGDEQQGSPDQKPQPAARLTKEQAERLLDALKDNEMEMIKARLKSKRKKDVEKDW